MERIAAQYAHLAVPIDELVAHPRNARRGNVELLAKSLKAHGQYRPAVVQKSTGYVLSGNHMVRAARELGWTHVAAVVLDVDDSQALQILAGDNRSSDVAEYDTSALLDVLHELEDSGALDPTGFSGLDVDALERLVDATESKPLDPKDEWTDLPEFEAGNRMSVFHTTVHFASPEDADAFFAKLDKPKRSSMWWPDYDGFVGSRSDEHYVSAADVDA